ncbi:MAG: GTPase [Actinomycetota bacterium]
MQADLRVSLEAFDRVLAAAHGVVDPDLLRTTAERVRSVRDRAGYMGDTLVAAVAGGTGSGKSSLINALAGEIVTESGGLRPTTGEPMAWIPADPEPGLVRLLDDLGVEERVGQDLHPWLALLDLPDTDSVVVDHRHRVEALLPRVDLVLWVIDPEKYQDRALHERYLRPLAPYREQFVFVLNQIDRLDGGTLRDMEDDLRHSLREDGIPDPVILAVAADPDLGPPVGVDDMIENLERTLDAKRVVYRKLATDLSESARRLLEESGLEGGSGFGPRWEEVRYEAARLLAEGDRRRCEALLGTFVEDVAEEAGEEGAQAVRDELGPAAVAEAVDVAVESSGAFRRPGAPPAPGWIPVARWLFAVAALAGLVWGVDRLRVGGDLLGPFLIAVLGAGAWVGAGVWSSRYRTRAAVRAREAQRAELVEPIARALDAQLGRALRVVLRRRSAATAAATELNLALADLERRLEA